MQRRVLVFVITRERAPGGPPEPAREITVEAPTVDGLLAAARERLASEGRVRSVSFGPEALVVYVEATS